ncbi:SAM-dependent methyltransferase [Sphingobacterium sp. UT-1RO-CII-1]|uniref:class I SAM-dependent methyltransferase n=1 Tax=Sphingobacterium sp. UT-1RO-CII-1 TaxID=2995225 RepID=UPI00227B91B5|nr:SAM-dependent methyltransferase [Sphingobacterium sp. UT-1RO-CII-1]MCY4780178.1 SAM-dependent methyltransferase [Sphingobacterium sp. UT-1RO-CII-1]
MDKVSSFIAQLNISLADNSFIKLSLGNYKGAVSELKKIYVKPVIIKRVLKLSFTYRFQTKDVVKNFTIEDGISEIVGTLKANEFRVATMFKINEDLILSYNRGDWSVKSIAATAKKTDSLNHDRLKQRKLGSSEKNYLKELRLTDENGKVYKNAQDKWKQINHYIDILSSMLGNLPDKEKLSVVDMGAGKGYLTFALYDYLNNILQKPAEVIGVEYRLDLVDLCNSIALRSGFMDLNFVEGTIEAFKPKDQIDILIALHACDTATDDAISKGIENHAELIVVAPCCHKQVRKQMEIGKVKNELDFLTRHGIFMERQAEMVTDGMRALIMEYFGYQTKVFQFVSDAHTPKNVLVVGVRKEIDDVRRLKILEKIKTTKAYFGLEYHYLEKLMNL